MPLVSEQKISDNPIRVHWKFRTHAGDRKKAGKVLDWVIAGLRTKPQEARIEKHHVGGFILSFSTMTLSRIWSEQVLEVLGAAQSLGYGWHVTGSIRETFNASCEKSRITGINFIHVTCWCQENTTVMAGNADDKISPS